MSGRWPRKTAVRIRWIQAIAGGACKFGGSSFGGSIAQNSIDRRDGRSGGIGADTFVLIKKNNPLKNLSKKLTEFLPNVKVDIDT